MRKTALLAALAIALATILHAVPAQAQRVFVSGVGSDSNPCTVAAPCRSFQQAHNTAPANGEIDVLDPAGYGPLTITKPISIQAHGFGGITAGSGANAITINTSSNVNLNGLLIDGAGVGADGILVSNANLVTIANCVVRNFAKNGIEDPGATLLTVVNTIASDNGYNGANYSGIYIYNSSGVVISAALTGVTATGNGANGIVVQGNVYATVFSSNASNNSTVGILAQSTNGYGATVMVRDTVASNNFNDGFEAQTSAQLILAHSVASGNFGGVYVNGGTVNTYKDNHIYGNLNGADVIGGSLTPVTAD